MKNYKLMILSLLLCLNFSCTKKQEKTSTKLKFFSSSSIDANPLLRGGVMVYAHNNSSNKKIGLNVGASDGNFQLDNGDWDFFAVAWDGNQKMTGTLRCGVVSQNLGGADAVVELTLNTVNCSDPIYGDNTFKIGNQFKPITFISCETLASISAGNQNCNGSEAAVGSYQISLYEFSGTGTDAPLSKPLTGECITENPVNSLTSTTLTLPTGGTQAMFLVAGVKLFKNTSCSGVFNSVLFHDGISQLTTESKTLEDTSQTSIYLKSFFPPTISSFAIDQNNNQIILNGDSLNTVSSIIINGTGISNEPFDIDLINSTQIKISAITAGMRFVADTFYDLILTTAHGDITIPISFTPSFSNMVYQGAWNANTNTPSLDDAAAETAGNFYIVGTAGSNVSVAASAAFAIGDKVISNGTIWEKVANSTGVTTLAAMTDTTFATLTSGDIITYTGSEWINQQINLSLSGLSDINGSLVPSNNDMLLFNGTDWNSSTVPNAILSAGGINNNHITGLDASKLTGVLPAIDGSSLTGISANDATKLPLAGGIMTGNLDLGSSKMIGNGGIEGIAITNSGQVKVTEICDETGINCKDISTGWGAGGSVTSVASGTGLTGGPITGAGTLNVDVGTTAGKIVQIDGTGTLPAIDGSKLTNLPIQNHTLSSFSGGSNTAVTVSDTVLTAIQNLQGQLNFRDTEHFRTDGTMVMTGQLQAQTGDASNPGYTFNGDISTGIFRPAVSDISITTGGTEAMRILGNGNVGIGTTTPNTALHVNGNIKITGGAPAIGKFLATDASGLASWQLLPNVLKAIDGTPAAPSITFLSDATTGISKPAANTLVFSTAGVEKMRIDNAGNIGIGTATPSYALHVNGQVAGNAAYVNTSDERYKENIVVIANALDKIQSLRGVYFDWRTDEFPEMNFVEGRDFGVIAQNVEQAFPEAIVEDAKGFKSVAYAKFIAPLIEATKELHNNQLKFETMQTEITKRHGELIDSLIEENIKLRTKVDLIKNILCEMKPDSALCE